MSQNALWIALSVDWADSPMLDGLTPSARLAWVCLLCEAKAKGRGGMVRIRASKFAATYNLEPACVDEMIEAAKGGGAIIQDRDGSVEIVNWRKYQHRASKAESRRQKFPAPEKVQKVPTGQDRTGQDRTDPPHPSGGPPGGGTTSRTFVPPTVIEVRAYCDERNNGINADRFLAHYEARGWMAGKSKVKDWRACVRTWEKTGDENGRSDRTNPDHAGAAQTRGSGRADRRAGEYPEPDLRL